jgi:ABC-type glycerol-3-phosphate transport system substrate-binding protein
MKKFLLFLLLASFAAAAVSSFSSCASAKKESDNPQAQADDSDNPANSGSEAEQDAVKESYPPPELPDINLQGADFVVVTNDYSIPIWSQRDFGAEAETGDTINDAVYRRNSLVDDRFNCKVTENKVMDLTGLVKKLVKAGDSSIDAATVRLRNLSDLATSNNLAEFNHLTYIDPEAPWWDQNCVKDLSIAHKVFGVASDMTLMDKDSTTAMVFNKKMQADYGIENLYKLVDEGKWTLDKLLEMCKLVSIDVDGNGIFDDKDAYGFLYQRDTMTSFLSGCGEFVGGKDENDLPILTLNTPKALEVLDKLYDILYDERYCFHVMKFFDKTTTGFTDGMNIMFQDDRGLFMWIRMADVENLRTMDTDFGILPIPKYNEKQAEYLQTVNPYVGVVTSIPQCAGSFDTSSAVVEYMSYESKYILQPAYYEVVLNNKIARDEESSKMLDIIFSNRAYDIGDVFDFGGLGSDLLNMTMTFDRNIVSKYDKKESSALKAIDKLVDKIQEIE